MNKKTFNYSAFSFMNANRTISQALVNRLIKSIQEVGYIEARPVIVNQQMVIIDGQHRFLACKRLGLPICYQVSNVDMNKAMLALNMSQVQWSLWDYVESWAKNGVSCCNELIEFRNKYNFNSTVTTTIVIGSTNNETLKAIKLGKERPINKHRHEIAKFVLECKPFLPFFDTKTFVSAVVDMFNKTNKDERNRLLNGIQSLRQQPKSSDYRVAFENIINRGKSSKNRISLSQPNV